MLIHVPVADIMGGPRSATVVNPQDLAMLELDENFTAVEEEIYSLPDGPMGRGFPDYGVMGWWKTACQRRKVMALFDEPGLMIHNKRVKAVGAAIAKGALMSLASKESLAHTLFGRVSGNI